MKNNEKALTEQNQSEQAWVLRFMPVPFNYYLQMGKQKLKRESDLADLKNYFMMKHVTVSFVMKQLLGEELKDYNLL